MHHPRCSFTHTYRSSFRTHTHPRACAHQAAFILSRLRKPPDDETQETLRTTSFPTTHIKEKWDNNLYIMALAYGKTVS